MPRIRTIKPEFFTSDTVSELPLRARLTWIGLWTHCDDYGRCRDNVKLVKAAVWPLDAVSLRDVEEDLETLTASGLLHRYTADGKAYLQVTSWAEHQKVDRPSKSNIPAPDTREILASPREPASNPRAGKGKEGKGREGSEFASQSRETPAPTDPGPEPPPRCPTHLNDESPPPCGKCADARKAHDAWDASRAAAASAARSAVAKARAEAVAAAIADCDECDSDGYRNGVLCSHDPTQAERARAGAAAARAALAKPASPVRP